MSLAHMGSALRTVPVIACSLVPRRTRLAFVPRQFGDGIRPPLHCIPTQAHVSGQSSDSAVWTCESRCSTQRERDDNVKSWWPGLTWACIIAPIQTGYGHQDSTSRSCTGRLDLAGREGARLLARAAGPLQLVRCTLGTTETSLQVH